MESKTESVTPTDRELEDWETISEEDLLTEEDIMSMECACGPYLE